MEVLLDAVHTVPLKKFATTAKRQTPSTAFDGFGAAGRLEPSAASRQTPGGVGGCQTPSRHRTSNDVLEIERGHARHDLKIHAHHY